MNECDKKKGKKETHTLSSLRHGSMDEEDREYLLFIARKLQKCFCSSKWRRVSPPSHLCSEAGLSGPFTLPYPAPSKPPTWLSMQTRCSVSSLAEPQWRVWCLNMPAAHGGAAGQMLFVSVPIRAADRRTTGPLVTSPLWTLRVLNILCVCQRVCLHVRQLHFTHPVH